MNLGFGNPYQVDPNEIMPGQGGGLPNSAPDQRTASLVRGPQPEQPFWQQLLMARAQNPRQGYNPNVGRLAPQLGAPAPYEGVPAFGPDAIGGPPMQAPPMQAPPRQPRLVEAIMGRMRQRQPSAPDINVGGTRTNGMYASPVEFGTEGWASSPRPQALHEMSQVGMGQSPMQTYQNQIAALNNVYRAPPTNYAPYETRRMLPAELTAPLYGAYSMLLNPSTLSGLLG